MRAQLGLVLIVATGCSRSARDVNAVTADTRRVVTEAGVVPGVISDGRTTMNEQASTRNTQFPLRIRWEAQGTLLPGSVLTLKAHVTRDPRIEKPLHVTLHVPAGVTVVRGVLAFDLPPTPSEQIDTFEYVLSLVKVPTEDLTIVADAKGTGWGVHAEVPYRFGRVAPEVQGPRAEGPRVVVGGMDLGPAIPVGMPHP